ncbi:MAG: hypothetical protein U1B83_03225, partial [Candidatus Cloacimonadaceae bacterium]|nr:hypothetical protein [Candidatus Cloacimonadaceae bacterium]
LSISAARSPLSNYRVMVTGRITGTGMIGDTAITSIDSSNDIFWAELGDPFGVVQHWGGSGSDIGRACSSGIVSVLAASFENSVSFYGNPLSSSGGMDVALIFESGESARAGGANNEVVNGVENIGGAEVAICGWFSGLARFGNHLVDSGNDTNLNVFVAAFDRLASPNDDPAIPPVQSMTCHPNPFKDSVNISVKDIYLNKISIYNLRGQKVRELSPDTRSSLGNSFVWDGRDTLGQRCASGIYRVLADGAKSGGSKVLLLK